MYTGHLCEVSLCCRKHWYLECSMLDVSRCILHILYKPWACGSEHSAKIIGRDSYGSYCKYCTLLIIVKSCVELENENKIMLQYFIQRYEYRHLKKWNLLNVKVSIAAGKSNTSSTTFEDFYIYFTIGCLCFRHVTRRKKKPTEMIFLLLNRHHKTVTKYVSQ